MAKHNRNQTRKLFQREVATAIKDVCKKGKKAVTPEGLKARFNHLISNQSDVDAIANYGPAFERAYFKANGSTAVQLKNLLQTQLEQLEKMVPKIFEYDRAVYVALKHWTEGEAKRLIKYEVLGGLGAWRKIYIE